VNLAFSQGFIEELKMRNPIEDVVSRYVDLKRAGRNMVGRCPFHSEKSPSFTLFSDHFHCFGCSAGGDVITFVMRIENLDYPDAVNFLADRCGMTVPDDRKYFTKTEKPKLTRERGFAMNKAAARIFYENLKDPDAAEAREYISKRQLSASTVKHFGLGFAKNSFIDLFEKLTALGYTLDEIKANFLCGVSQKTNRPFDMFRNRIMFPIIDTSGNIVAFGGRVMDDSKPKYLNSSDTVVFKKSKNLFALNFAKDLLLGNVKSELVKSGEIILCEGYMDVIAMHQAGFCNAVATLGTAVTPEHSRIVARYAKTAYLAYDSDDAGKKAADKAIRLLGEVGVETKVIKINGAKDPDEYIKKFGVASFSTLLSDSVGQIDYRLNNILVKFDLANPDEKLRALRECCDMLSGIFSDIKRDIYIQRLSELTGIKQDSIASQIKSSKRHTEKKMNEHMNTENQKKLLHFNDRVNPDAVTCPAAVEIEERILGILMLFPEQFSKCDSVTPDDFVSSFNKSVFEKLSELYGGETTDISSLNEFFNPEQMSRIYDMRQRRTELTSNGIAALNEQIASLKREKTRLEAKKNKVGTNDELQSMIERIRKDKGLE